MISKKIKFLSFLTATTLLFSGCTMSVDSNMFYPNTETPLATFAGDTSPLKMIQGGDTYYSFVGKFGDLSYSLSVSDDITKTNVVYEPSHPAVVWFAEANEKYVTWCETAESGNTILLYNKEDNSVTDIFKFGNVEYYLKNVGIYNDSVYFAKIDYEKETADIMCYNILDKSLNSIYSAEFTSDYAITSLSVSGNVLTAVTNVKGTSKLVVLNLDTMEKPTISTLPKNAYFVFDAEYDSATSTFALYYVSTDKKEYIGTYKAGEDIENIYTFRSSYFAYQDSIEFIDGNIYWIMQANKKSITTTPERYAFISWNHETDEFLEYSRTYNLCINEDDIYYLSFDAPSRYTNVVLNKVE